MSLDNEQVVHLIEKMDSEAKAIKKEALKFTWFMRGGVTYNEAMLLDKQEREIILGIIESNMETTKESVLPFY